MGNVIVCSILLLIVCGIVFSMIKNKKNAKNAGGCGCGCAGCSNACKNSLDEIK